MSNKKITSKSIASLAAQVLKANDSSATAKKLAGSALSQVNKENQTGKKLEHLASAVLQSDKYNKETKELAGSILSQSNKTR